MKVLIKSYLNKYNFIEMAQLYLLFKSKNNQKMIKKIMRAN